ncbi:MAG: hypothetical protein KAI81_06980 [Candidatus Marinimicrobia bacterium]|nr:hypothetical protein [Candidatus Neomarinimicrobiota bacterium]
MNPYLKNQILSAPGNDLVTYTYDAAIISCHRCDRIRALEAVDTLIKGLRTDEHPEIALLLYGVYRQILEHIYRAEYNIAGEWLQNLRDIWKEII